MNKRSTAPRGRTVLLALTLALAGCAGTPRKHAVTAQAAGESASPHASIAAATSSASAPAAAPATTAPAAAGGGGALAAAAHAAAGSSDLKARLDALVSEPRFAAARWGVDVIDLDSGRSLYHHDAGKLFIPASNAKLYTATLALAELGPRFRFTTRLYASAHRNRHGVLHGDLLLIGGGDPSLGAGSDTQTPDAWADQLAQAMYRRGIRRVDGDIIGDDTRYRGTRVGAGWEANDLQSAFAPPVSALSVQGNTLSVRVDSSRDGCCRVRVDPNDSGLHVRNLAHTWHPGDSERAGIGLFRPPGADTLYVYGSLPAGAGPRYFELSAPDPAHMAAALLRDAMIRRGIAFHGRLRTRHWPRAGALTDAPDAYLVGSVQSRPLAELVRHTLKHSDNLYAQLLLLAVGHRQAQAGVCSDRPRPPRTTEGWGLCAMRALLQRAGIVPGQALLEEGTGLSRKDLVSPAATTRLLAWAATQNFARVLRDALPEAGVDGTLRYRLRGPDTAGRLHAKTGTLHFAYTLSGYVRDRGGRPLVFSIMLNNYHAPADAQGRRVGARPSAALDAVARAIAGDDATARTADASAARGNTAAPGAP